MQSNSTRRDSQPSRRQFQLRKGKNAQIRPKKKGGKGEQDPSNGHGFVRIRNHRPLQEAKDVQEVVCLAVPAQGRSKGSISEQRHPWEAWKRGSAVTVRCFPGEASCRDSSHTHYREERASSCPWKRILTQERDSAVRSGGSADIQLQRLNEAKNR